MMWNNWWRQNGWRCWRGEIAVSRGRSRRRGKKMASGVVQEASLFNCKMGGGMGSVSGMLPIANNRNPATESASLKQKNLFFSHNKFKVTTCGQKQWLLKSMISALRGWHHCICLGLFLSGCGQGRTKGEGMVLATLGPLIRKEFPEDARRPLLTHWSALVAQPSLFKREHSF